MQAKVPKALEKMASTTKTLALKTEVVHGIVWKPMIDFLVLKDLKIPFISRITYNSSNKNLHILTMGSSLHNAHHEWIIRVLGDLVISGPLTVAENHALLVIRARYSICLRGFVKLADYSITPNFTLYASIVLECGWSESFPRLRKDKDI